MNKNIMDKRSLKGKIEPFLYNEIKGDVEVKEINLNLAYNRFDLAFKLIYLDLFIVQKKRYLFPQHIYKEHIKAFSLGSFKEPGNADKNTIESFEAVFESLYKEINTFGFNGEKSVIPLASDGSILSGAHRAAISILLEEKVKVVYTGLAPYLYDYNFFYKRNVSTHILDAVATKFIENSQNTYIAFIWPISYNNNISIDHVIPNVVYKKEVSLNANGAHNLLSQIYRGEKWLGTVENNFSGVTNKLVECFKTFDPVRVVAFQAKSLNDVLIIKEKIRKIFNVGKHSVHITDTPQEALQSARAVFNDNSTHFLNYAKPNNYFSTFEKIKKFKMFLDSNELPPSKFTLDSSFTLSVYGLREANDIDYLGDIDREKIKTSTEGIDSNDEELIHHNFDKLDIIYDPQSFFYFEGLKFISFKNLYDFKKKRNKDRDINDCKMMEALIENNSLKMFLNSTKQNFLYFKVKLKSNFISFLKRVKLYKLIRNFYNYTK